MLGEEPTPGEIGKQLHGEISAALESGDVAALGRIAGADVETRLALLAFPSLPAEILERLATGSEAAPVGVADHAARTADELAAAADGLVRRIALARMHTAPAESLRALAGDLHTATREAVAANPATPPDVLKRLLGDHSPAVLRAVAANPALPAEMADDMATSKWEYEDAIEYTQAVWARLAANPATPPETLGFIAAEWGLEYDVVLELAANPNTPITALAALADDPAESTAAAIAAENVARRAGAALSRRLAAFT